MTEPWYVRRFDAGYLDLYAHRDAGEAEQVTECVLAPLGLAGSRVLDLACGGGRYASSVARRGASVVGLDLSAPLLAAGRAAGNTPSHGFVRGDMTHLPFRAASFDLVLSMFTSFGYLQEPADDRNVLAEVARVLRPGGRFVLDFLNAKRLRAQLVPESVRDTSRGKVHERRWVDDARGVVVKEMQLEDAKSEHWDREEVRLWEAPALLVALADAGLATEEVRGDYAGAAFVAAESPRLIIVARRRTRRNLQVATRAGWDDLTWGGQAARDAASGRLPAGLAAPGITNLRRCVPETSARRDFVEAMASGDARHLARWRALLDPAARVVVTGQQPGCAGGPLLVLYKAATAVALARRATHELERPVLPVFWNATDDVDFDEIAQVAWPNESGDPSLLELSRAGRAAASWVGDLAAAGDVAALQAALSGAPEAERTRTQALLPATDTDHGAWVGEFLAHVFPDLVILDARRPEVRLYGAALFARYLDRWEAANAALASTSASLAAAGYAPALDPESTAMGLFVVAGGRRTKTQDRELLRTTLARTPENLAPNVILRALLQDTLLPTVAHVVGAAEQHYLLELRALRRLLEVHEPALVQRFTATVIDRARWEAIRDAGLEFPLWLQDPEAATVAASRARASGAVEAIGARFAALRLDALGLEPRVVERAARRLDAVRADLEAGAVNAARAALVRTLPSLAALPGLVRPRDRAQERLVAGAWLLARTGPALGAALVEFAAAHCDDLMRGAPAHSILVLDAD